MACRPPQLDYGLDVQRLDPTIAPGRLAEQSRAWAAYIAKGLAQEAALGAAKEAKGSNRTIRQLMRAALIAQRFEDPATGTIVDAVDLTARAKLAEYEAAITGRKQLTWSQGRHDHQGAYPSAPGQGAPGRMAALALYGIQGRGASDAGSRMCSGPSLRCAGACSW